MKSGVIPRMGYCIGVAVLLVSGGCGLGGSPNTACFEPDAGPEAVIQATPTSGPAPLTVSFDGSGSTSRGAIVEYLWDFGDGDIDTGPSIQHVYPFQERYRVTLSVVDDVGCSGTAAIDIQVSSDVTFSVGGMITAEQGIGLDGDTNNPATPHVPNNSSAEAQAIGPLAIIGGYVTAIPTAQADLGGATQANPVRITTTAMAMGDLSHPFDNGDRIRITGVTGMVELNDREFVVANATHSSFELAGTDGTGFGAFTGGGLAALSPLPTDRFAAEADEFDTYRATLAEGQSVVLTIADWDAADPLRNDLDLLLFDAESGELVADSLDTERREHIIVPLAGTYDIVVQAFNGRSNYTLSEGAVLPTDAERETLSSAGPFIHDEVVMRLDPGVRVAQAHVGEYTRTTFGMTHVAGDPSHLLLAKLPAEGPRDVFRAGGARRTAWFDRASPETRRNLETVWAVKRLRAHREVEQAEPNYLYTALVEPNDRLFFRQWHYPSINLPQAWEIDTGSADVIVAIADTGVFLFHNDLIPNLIDGYDFVTDPARSNDGDGIDPNADDPGDRFNITQASWHGTHVAGTVSVGTDNGRGVAGVSWGARLMPIRVLGVGGGSNFDILEGVRYAAGLRNASETLPPRRADIINLSLGGPRFSRIARDVYREVRAAGVLIVAAAGNSNIEDPFYPAAYDAVVSVSATGPTGQRAFYSNFGSTIDVAAPGGDLRSDVAGDGVPDGVASTYVSVSPGGQRTSSYAFLMGTSMACPHVAGVMALMKSTYPDLTPGMFDTLLASGAITRDFGRPGRDDIFGHGLIDARRALEQAAQLAGGATPPSVLVADPPQLLFGTRSSMLSVQVARSGDRPLSIGRIVTAADWLTVEPTDVDSNGLGTYQVTAARGELDEGVYASEIIFTADTGFSVAVAVALQVGNPVEAGDPGLVAIQLIDADSDTLVTQRVVEANEGAVEYTFEDVEPAVYYVICGTDIDNDGLICDPGEACGTYPLLSLPEPVRVTDGDRSGVDFIVTFDTDILSQGAVAADPIGE